VIPADYVASGSIRRYAQSGGPFTSATARAVSRWLASSLVRPYVEPPVAARVARPLERERFYTQDKDGSFVMQDDQREMVNIFFPMAFAMLLGLCLTVGGQYLLQGVSEEKESRILESLLTSVRPDELMIGKLAGLGSVGLLVVVIWAGTGLAAAAPMLSTLQVAVAPSLMGLAVVYFLLGYLFYGSIMLGIGGVTNNMREAQQFSVWFTFANFAPMIALWAILSHPDGPLATGLSMFPPTAASTMMLRLTAQNSAVPAWQIALSLALLGGSAWLTLRGAARVFRIGMLLYGKTPNLPEILRWARSS
jgi:ABC-2 type transport system permease protein